MRADATPPTPEAPRQPLAPRADTRRADVPHVSGHANGHETTPPPLPPEATSPPRPLALPTVPRVRTVPPPMDGHLWRAYAPPPPVAAPPLPSAWSLWRVVGTAMAAALLLRACVFDAYRIPSSSMEQTLQPGDYVFVSKVGYGARVPEAVRLPFTARWVRNPIAPGARLPGLGGPARGDVAVFHYPPEGGPVSGRTPYVKRIVGLPGETVEIRARDVFVDGRPLAPPPTGRGYWIARLAPGAALSPEALARAGATGRHERVGERQRLVEATPEVAARVAALPGVESIERLVRRPGDGSARFPLALRYSLDDWGPVRAPARGLTVALDDATWPVYRDAITRHEGAEAQRVPGGFLIDGAPAASYTFSQDYYIVLGDHRDDSADSRSWGFVPADHLIGEAKVVYFSWDPPNPPRWDRVLHGVQ